ncbi:MAG: hypothetical protein CMO81_11660 [Waddliaceae bacterium]|nr:hypothetical protein [Waddliaceae bacterium]
MPRIVLGVSGASGISLAQHALLALVEAGYTVDLIMTRASLQTAQIELGDDYSSPAKFVAALPVQYQDQVVVYRLQDFSGLVASGTKPTEGMMILPCSMATVAAISQGLSDNLLRRAADVTLKERRPLVLVPREAPFSTIHLENMLRLSKAGATILPPVPAWYTKPQTIEEIEKFIVGRVLDCFRIPHELYPRWEGTPKVEKKELEQSVSIH